MGIFDLIGKAYWGIVTAVADPIVKFLKPSAIPLTAKELAAKPFGKVLETGVKITTLGLGVAAIPAALPIVAKAIVAKPIIALGLGGLAITKGGRKLIGVAAEGIFVGAEKLGVAFEEAEKKGEEITIGEAWKTAGLLGAGLILGAGAPAIIEKGKEIFAETFDVVDVPPEKQLVKEKPIGIEGEAPLAPETATITTGKKPYKRRRKKIAPSVRQSVKINIINQPRTSQSNRYLNANPL